MFTNKNCSKETANISEIAWLQSIVSNVVKLVGPIN